MQSEHVEASCLLPFAVPTSHTTSLSNRCPREVCLSVLVSFGFEENRLISSRLFFSYISDTQAGGWGGGKTATRCSAQAGFAQTATGVHIAWVTGEWLGAQGLGLYCLIPGPKHSEPLCSSVSSSVKWGHFIMRDLPRGGWVEMKRDPLSKALDPVPGVDQVLGKGGSVSPLCGICHQWLSIRPGSPL